MLTLIRGIARFACFLAALALFLIAVDAVFALLALPFQGETDPTRILFAGMFYLSVGLAAETASGALARIAFRD